MTLIQMVRLSSFMHKNTMKPYQRYFVSKAQRYNLSTNEDTNELAVKEVENENNLIGTGYNKENYDKQDEMVE